MLYLALFQSRTSSTPTPPRDPSPRLKGVPTPKENKDGVEVTELSTNKQHTFSTSLSL